MKFIPKTVVVLFLLGFVSTICGQASAPANVAAALTLKILKYERNISSGGDVTIYVIGAPDVQSELTKGVGKPIGNSTLKAVDGGKGVPSSAPSILFIGNAAQLEAATAYTQEQDIMSVTHNPDLVSRGATLGIGVGDDGKPRIMINLTSSAEENLNWNSAIMKIATTID